MNVTRIESCSGVSRASSPRSATSSSVSALTTEARIPRNACGSLGSARTRVRTSRLGGPSHKPGNGHSVSSWGYVSTELVDPG